MYSLLEGETDAQTEAVLTEEILQYIVQGEAVAVANAGSEEAVFHANTDLWIHGYGSVELLSIL